ncbi:DnaB-like helicase N-terminal domain-containing protein [Kitasatospora purpeofusca]|uniref:DnaB-like helicase N-terminal domain-containing protein n=1 Tax=Kitasatospora purpeofusca TaxID=67352 RepID=UPI002255F73D|nr:DnaB-like helicase N-terminal domain-containing protein [Kitasatospora purpeofusca]MCX4758773.1 helicase DnaB [Kitasatospora purpeofusca]WSR30797.1 helicase DnaB [Kitasatospora purpeofusca]
MNPQMEAEQAVLGAILLAPERLRDVAGWLRPEHFYRPAHAALFEVLLAQDAAGHPAPPDTDGASSAWATQAMASAAEASPGFTPGYGHTLIAACPVTGHAAAYGRMVLETAVRRQVHEHAHRLLAAARTGAVDGTLRLTGDLRAAIGQLADAWGSLDENPRPLPGPWPLELPPPAVEETLRQEAALLASLTALPREVRDISPWLHPADFLDRGHRAVYRAVAALAHRGEPIDPLTVLWEIQHHGDLASGTTTADAVRAVTRAGFSGDPGYWAEQVLQGSVLRSALTAAGTVRMLSLDTSLPAARLLGSALHTLRGTEAVQKRWRAATGTAGADGNPVGEPDEPEHRRDAARARSLAPVPDTGTTGPASPAQQAACARAPIRSSH